MLFKSQPLLANFLLITATAIFAWTIGGEKFVWHDIVGGLLIITSVIFAQVTETNKAKKTLL